MCKSIYVCIYIYIIKFNGTKVGDMCKVLG